MIDNAFASQIRERYPEGLTGIFAIGGTRTTYILEHNRHAADPGHIEDFADQGKFLLTRYLQLIQMFFELGGQNMILTAFSFRGFHNRGDEYQALAMQELVRIVGDEAQAFYREHGIDPYFVGIDTLSLLPEGSPAQQAGKILEAFQQSWNYTEGRRKLVWEVASMPLHTFWKVYASISEQDRFAFEAQVESMSNLEDIYRLYYKTFSQAIYGTEIPMPHFYLGTNKSGDLKWRSPMPLALSGGDYLRLFYTPYPTLFITAETMHSILEDLAFKDRFYSAKTDYASQYTPDLVQAEYDRVMALSADPQTTLGFSRKVKAPAEQSTD
ncbi:MAG: hypothetical protein ABI947_24800 [Chloroflexota bacterium]